MDLGQVFANVPRVNRPVEGCTYCYAPEDLDALGGDPALVPEDLVGAFAREVTDHWAEDQYGLIWRGLAPRILAILDALPDERTLHGLAYAHFAEWPKHEQTAVRWALREMVGRTLASDRPAFELQDMVCAAAHTDQNLAPWLSYLDTLTGPDVDAGIARLARLWTGNLFGGESPSMWLPGDQSAAVRTWLKSDAVQTRLARIGDHDTMQATAEI